MDAPGHRGPPDRRDDRRAHASTRCSSPTCASRPRTWSARSNDGWSLAKVTLGNERVSLSGGGALWGHGPDRRRPARPGARAAAAPTDPVLRQRLAALLHRGRDPAPHPPAHRDRGASRASRPGPRRRCARRWPTSTASTIMALAKDLAGADGMLDGDRAGPLGGDPGIWHYGYLFTPGAHRSAAAPARCSATSSPSGSSACPTTPDRDLTSALGRGTQTGRPTLLGIAACPISSSRAAAPHRRTKGKTDAGPDAGRPVDARSSCSTAPSSSSPTRSSSPPPRSGGERITYGEWADAHPPPGRRARRPGHLRRRPRRHVRLEHAPATSSCTSPRRAPAGCCTPSTSGSSPSRSPTSSTTPRTR